MKYTTAIAKASQASYNDDAYYVVGKRDHSGWVYRHCNDPEADFLLDAVLVGGDGVQPAYEPQHFSNLQEEKEL